VKRQRPNSSEPSSPPSNPDTPAATSEMPEDIKKRSRNGGLKGLKEKEQRDKELREKERERAETASKRKGRAERRRGEGACVLLLAWNLADLTQRVTCPTINPKLPLNHLRLRRLFQMRLPILMKEPPRHRTAVALLRHRQPR